MIIEQDHVEDWLSGGALPPEPELGRIKRHPVDRAVNRIGEDHAGLIRPIPRLFDQEYGA